MEQNTPQQKQETILIEQYKFQKDKLETTLFTGDSTTHKNSYISYQNISETIFTLCNTTYSNEFLNISFKDESDSSVINASIPTSTFNYWLGDGSVNKTLTFINNTANPSYPFCSIPLDKSLNVDMVVQYKNTTSYPQRTYDPAVQVLTNTTTNKTIVSFVILLMVSM